jgi:hypothetical protein
LVGAHAVKYLLFRSDPSPGGLSNLKMALDIGVGLAHLTGRTLVVYENDPLWDGPAPVVALRRPAAPRPTILDLFDLPVPHVREEFFSLPVCGLSLHRCAWHDFPHSLFYYPADMPTGDRAFEDFCNGRRYAYTIDERLNAFDVLQVDARPLALYSYFFYLPAARRADFVRLMAAVRPKLPYQRFADELSRHLGQFNAVHIRRSDSKRTTPRTGVVTANEIVSNLRDVLPTAELLVICTDESSEREFFAPLLAHYKRAVFLDRLILDEPMWADRFYDLPYHRDPTLALVTQLVAAQAARFAGTLFSTFTALIHRLRGFRFGREPFLYAFDQFTGHPPFVACQYRETRDGHFSWNRLDYPKQPDLYAWFREWPEAFS